MTLACRSIETESRKSPFIFVTPRVESSFSASIIEDLKYLLKAHLSIFFKLAFVVRSNGCNRCIMFFGTITDSIPCFDRISDTMIVDWALKASNIRKLFWSFGRPFFSLNFLLYSTRTCDRYPSHYSNVFHCTINKNHWGYQRLGVIFVSFTKPIKTPWLHVVLSLPRRFLGIWSLPVASNRARHPIARAWHMFDRSLEQLPCLLSSFLSSFPCISWPKVG